MDAKTFKTLARGWEAYGRVDSMFGVLSDRSKLGQRWTPEEFFATGREHIANLMRVLVENGCRPARGACLDFGCGIGRLTQPLADHFDSVVGVDVASSMIAQANRFNRAGARCRYVLNRAPDLRQFPDASFDLVHSCITLQHMTPDLAAGYVTEFFRVARPGGLVVFQLPAEPRPEHLSAGAFALPASGYAAHIELAAPLSPLRSGARAEVRLAVTNRGDAVWSNDIPTELAGRIRVANHWLAEDGSLLVNDDGRAELPRPVKPGDRVEVTMTMTAPAHVGGCVIEFDLVQELVSWFASKGSPTLRVPATIEPALVAATAPALAAQPEPSRAPARGVADDAPDPAPTPATRVSWFQRLADRLRRSRGGEPRFEMHAIPVADVTRIVQDAGGEVVRSIEDEAAGLHWQSFTHICRARRHS